MICTAKGPGWACTKPAGTAFNLCSAHYNQQRRTGRLKPIGSHRVAEDSVAVNVLVPREHMKTIDAEAARRQEPSAAVVREAIAEKVAKLEKGAKK
jgi:hypothetical protein